MPVMAGRAGVDWARAATAERTAREAAKILMSMVRLDFLQ
jgi:hypothetical protein